VSVWYVLKQRKQEQLAVAKMQGNLSITNKNVSAIDCENILRNARDSRGI